MRARGTRKEYNVEIDIDDREMFNALKNRVLGYDCNIIEHLYINKDNQVVDCCSDYFYEETVRIDDIDKVEMFRMILELERKFIENSIKRIGELNERY